ncbi:phytanoyl-CoA dioxygenase family protein [Paenibacillus spongiae]|uniref:Phytanoyl-CoA dioxygenase family protein n=1 Tax=Paenibacillus spongiae TaxID=2909671 RepID=A0ABY5S689_9BACL|nr:phytanoyl-CoA dioxygenase family protein [Paenibacillus spongiae]UVI28345.1 phytanoyl-CoA dioxygenase family protein [Paenibacillus spongiae]
MKLHALTDEQYLSWERDGFLVMENFLTAEEIKKYDDGLDSVVKLWKERGSYNSEHAQLANVDQVSAIIEYDDLFVELMEHPRMMKTLRDLLGDAFVMIDNDGLLKYPQQKAHTSWHRDTGNDLYVNGTRIPFMVKVFYFLADVPYDGGCLSFLPGSHKMRNDQLPKVGEPEDMPGHVRMNVKAGTAVAFHGSTYHSALNNFSSRTRRSVIYNYAPMFLRTWPGYEPSEALQAKASTRMRQMLLGMLPWMSDPKAFEE